MSIIAAGAYLKSFRERQGISRAQVAAEAGTNESQIFRIESGDVDTRTSLFFTIARSVSANFEDLALLILDVNATAEDGLNAAGKRFEAQEKGASLSLDPQEDTLTIEEQAGELLTEEQLALIKEIIPSLTNTEFLRLVKEIQAAVEEDPNSSGRSLIGALRTFVSGWRARSQSPTS